MTGDGSDLDTTRQQLVTAPEGEDARTLGIRWAFPIPTSLVTWARQERLVLGRGADCHVVLPGAETSRQHAEMSRRGPLWVVRDLGSRNGVYVDGRRVEQAGLEAGTVLRLGEWVGVVRQLSCSSDDAEVPFGELAQSIFGSTTLARALRHARAAASSDLRIVVQGETGTGKECVAQAIHAWSGRSGSFVAVNCAALPETLAEAELFGYRKGAFTGAERASAGYLRAAHGGTLLLDEITDLPPAVQPKLLRALEQQAVVPLGESIPVPIDVRIIAASQRSLPQAVRQNRFRADLWARLDGLTISLPPLRERSEDAPGLFARLLRQALGAESRAVEPRFIEQLCLYGWPGNVREVAQLARQLATLRGQEQTLRRSHLPERMLADGRAEHAPASQRGAMRGNCTGTSARMASEGASADDETDLRREEDLRALVQALRLHRGNIALVARELGISRQKAYRRLEALPDSLLDEFRDCRRPPAPHGSGRDAARGSRDEEA